MHPIQTLSVKERRIVERSAIELLAPFFACTVDITNPCITIQRCQMVFQRCISCNKRIYTDAEFERLARSRQEPSRDPWCDLCHRKLKTWVTPTNLHPDLVELTPRQKAINAMFKNVKALLEQAMVPDQTCTVSR